MGRGGGRHNIAALNQPLQSFVDLIGRKLPLQLASEFAKAMSALADCCRKRAVKLPPGRGTTESPMSLLTTSIESTRLTRWNFGLVALTLLGVFAIALALILPDSITP